MRKLMRGVCLLVHLLLVVFSFNPAAVAADRVVVVPLGGAVGDATPEDVVKGKTFSSKASGKGAVGSLKIRGGSTLYTNSIGMEFSLIPAGRFVMGSPDGTVVIPGWSPESYRDVDENQHVVTLTESFYMQTTEVTQDQWVQVMGSNPSYFTSCGFDCPVEQVSWNDAQGFIDTLNSREGRFPCNTAPYCYSLPTEAQWEYAARGGTVTAFYNGDITETDCTLDLNLKKIGWYCGNNEVSYSGCSDTSGFGGAACAGTHPVAQLDFNDWGLYDMSGNVWEWCADWYGAYAPGPVTDPTGASSGMNRVIRGGSWFYFARQTRSAYRNGNSPVSSNTFVGFRLVLPTGQ